MRFTPAITLFFLSTPGFAQIMTGGVINYGGPFAQTNNPVSMVFEHKQSQTLADGTHINTVTHEYFYRDSLGRTRSENEFPSMSWIGSATPIHSVSVQDPVARTFTSWQTGGPEGNPHQFNRFDQNPPQRPMMMPAPDSNQSHTIVPVRPAQATPRLQPKTITETMGTQDVQGISCEASKMRVIYPTDFMGNDRPITTVTDRCQSREFGRALRDSTEDPRSGTRSTTLQSVSRGEPDPSLFQPPPDYIEAKSQTH